MHGKRVGLALQGGGSYAAFTAGVLRGLLSEVDGCLRPEEVAAISGTSGGAINAVLLGHALHEPNTAPVAYVDAFWELNRLEGLLKERFRALRMLPDQVLAALVGVGRDLAQQTGAQSSANGALRQVAREILEELLRRAAPTLADRPGHAPLPDRAPYVTVAATEARTGAAHYFTSNGKMLRNYRRLEIARHRQAVRPLSMQGILASTAHPLLFSPVQIDDALYWDGYYTSNPPFMYLFREGCDEVVLVRLVQQHRPEFDAATPAVRDRIEEIVQNTAVNSEIMTYLAMRELELERGGDAGTVLRLGLGRFSRRTIFHEIRLLKPGNIDDEAFALSGLVERLGALGERAVLDDEGFERAYRGTEPGLQVVTEVEFDSGRVRSHILDIDKLLFEERGLRELARSRRTPAIFRFVKRLFS